MKALIDFWESSPYPCGLKDLNSRFVYVNTAYLVMQNLPTDYDIAGQLDGDLPTPTHEFEPLFQAHDQLVLQSETVKSSVEIHPFGKNKIVECWIFNKRPFYDQGKLCGVYFWAEPGRYLDRYIYSLHKHEQSTSILLNPPDPLLSKREWEFLYLLLNYHDVKSIARLLALSPSTVRNTIERMTDKLGVSGQKRLIEFAISQGWNRYIPQQYLIRHRILD